MPDGSCMYPLHILQVSTLIKFTVHSNEHSCEWCTRHPFCFLWGIFFMREHFDVRDKIHHEFAPYYKIVQQKVKKTVKRKRGSDHHWFLHHNNPPSQHSLIVQQYITKKAVTIIPHPPYSPDPSPCDFFSVPQFKWTMKGKWFQTTEEIRLAIERELHKITPSDFQCCNTQRVERWWRCINAGGEYFEGDH